MFLFINRGIKKAETVKTMSAFIFYAFSNFSIVIIKKVIKTIKMFQNGNVQMMYNYKGKIYKYPIDDKTSSMVAKIFDLGFKK